MNSSNPVKSTWKSRLAGWLLVVLGIVIYALAFASSSLKDPFGPYSGLVFLIASMIPIFGGLLIINRRSYGLALVIALFVSLASFSVLITNLGNIDNRDLLYIPFLFLPIPSIVLLIFSKNEFR